MGEGWLRAASPLRIPAPVLGLGAELYGMSVVDMPCIKLVDPDTFGRKKFF